MGVTNQKVAENWVSFDLGFLEHFRALEQRHITATVSYDPHTETCTSILQTTINGQVANLGAHLRADRRTAGTTQGDVYRLLRDKCGVQSNPSEGKKRSARHGGRREEGVNASRAHRLLVSGW